MLAAADRVGLGARYLTVREASVLLNVHEMTIRTWISRGIIPAVRISRAVRVDARKLEAMLEAQGQAQRQGRGT